MLFLRTTFSFVLSFLFRINLDAQNNCDFKIDTARIVSNASLPGFITHFKNDTFKVTNNYKDIPAFIKKQLDCLTQGFSIANPGEPYQATDVRYKNLPGRQLVFFAKSNNMLVLTYLKGGFFTSRHVVFIEYKDKKITDFWCGSCSNGMDTKESIINNINRNGSKQKKIYL